jgi:hypothetical protein
MPQACSPASSATPDIDDRRAREDGSRAEALSILASLALEGRTSAAIALVRELRPEDTETIDEVLERVLGE